METVTYEEAAGMLDVSLSTLKHAVTNRGVLTRAGRDGRNMLLVKEQVLLFTGLNLRTGNKKRLSLEALSPGENEAWHRYEMEAKQGQKQAPDSALVNEIVARQLAPIQEAMTGIARSTETARALRQQADEVETEGFRKAFSILGARASA